MLLTRRSFLASSAAFATAAPAYAAAGLYRSDPARTGCPVTSGLPHLTGARWSYKLGGRQHCTPALGDGLLVSGLNVYQDLFALDAETGKPRWTFRTGNVASPPTIAKGLVYFGSGDVRELDRGLFLAVDLKTGQERWRLTTGKIESKSPLVVDDLVYLASENLTLYALDAHSGRVAWKFAFALPHYLVIGHTAPAYADGTLYFGGSGLKLDGTGTFAALFALDARTGALKWQFSPRSRPNVRSDDRLQDMVAVSGGVVYGKSDNYLFAVDAGTGRQRWIFKAPRAITVPAVNPSRAYVGCFDGHVYGLDSATGAIVDRIPLAGYCDTAPVVVGDILYLAVGANGTQHESWLTAIDIPSRQVLWRFQPESSRGWSFVSPLVTDGRVYAGAYTGMYCLA
ncbi:MAG: PQQ-binding-like beta-propeller repeat protein [Acidobacteria bacterium]|nr:PQQ-binding-like beta-propeller repeat protein [Acidobacteriota bacterium]